MKARMVAMRVNFHASSKEMSSNLTFGLRLGFGLGLGFRMRVRFEGFGLGFWVRVLG